MAKDTMGNAGGRQGAGYRWIAFKRHSCGFAGNGANCILYRQAAPEESFRIDNHQIRILSGNHGSEPKIGRQFALPNFA
jgi:hypothetical protein